MTRRLHTSFSALQRAENSSKRRICRSGMLSIWSFSALQRAENSSKLSVGRHIGRPQQFQCSSASRKFLKASGRHSQRQSSAFQCSSASRKFLKDHSPARGAKPPSCFSALQRAENSSNPTLAPASIHISDRDDHASSFLSLPGASP